MKKKRLMITLLLIISILMFVGFAYAYLAAGVNNNNAQEASITTGTMNLTFADGTTSLEATEMTIGTSVTKTFTVENTGTLDASASMYFDKLVNTYMDGSMTYRLEYSENENGPYKLLKAETMVPHGRNFPQLISSIINVPAGEKLYYKLIITFNNLPDVDQTEDIDAVVNTKFTMIANSEYEYCYDDTGGFLYFNTFCYDTLEWCNEDAQNGLIDGCYSQTKTNFESDYCFNTLDENNTLECYKSYNECEVANDDNSGPCFEQKADIVWCNYSDECFDDEIECGSSDSQYSCYKQNTRYLPTAAVTEYCTNGTCYNTLQECNLNKISTNSSCDRKITIPEQIRYCYMDEGDLETCYDTIEECESYGYDCYEMIY